MDQEERTVLNLRDAFSEDADIDVRVTMLNINYGKNKLLLDSCVPLREYAWFVAEVNERQKEMNNLEAAVDAAINEMPDHFVIKPFLVANRSEVKNMFPFILSSLADEADTLTEAETAVEETAKEAAEPFISLVKQPLEELAEAGWLQILILIALGLLLHTTSFN